MSNSSDPSSPASSPSSPASSPSSPASSPSSPAFGPSSPAFGPSSPASGADFLKRFGDAENCLRHLERSRREILSLVDSLSDETLLTRPNPETWSPAEVLEHLLLTEEAASKVIRRMDKVARGEGEMFPPAPPLQKREDGRNIAPLLSEPKGGLSRAELLERLEGVRQRVKLEVAQSRELQGLTFAHPGFGPITGLGWLQSLVFHERHHLAQIQERLKQ